MAKVQTFDEHGLEYVIHGDFKKPILFDGLNSDGEKEFKIFIKSGSRNNLFKIPFSKGVKPEHLMGITYRKCNGCMPEDALYEPIGGLYHLALEYNDNPVTVVKNSPVTKSKPITMLFNDGLPTWVKDGRERKINPEKAKQVIKLIIVVSKDGTTVERE